MRVVLRAAEGTPRGALLTVVGLYVAWLLQCGAGLGTVRIWFPGVSICLVAYS